MAVLVAHSDGRRARRSDVVSAIERLLWAGGSFAILALVFAPLERAFPARRGQPFFRPAWRTDAAFFLGQYLVWNGLVLALIAPLGALFRAWVHGAHAAVASQPFALQVLEVVLLSDLLAYWGHRLQHRVGILWRFHAVHHSAERLDWMAAHREHPLDTAYTLTLINLPALVFGFPVASIAGLVAFRGLWAVYIHSNVRIPLGFLRAIVGSPELHHWHHARDREAGNYANLSPLMDLLFGTYRFHDEEPAAFGLCDPLPRSYLGQILHPFRPDSYRPTTVALASEKTSGRAARRRLVPSPQRTEFESTARETGPRRCRSAGPSRRRPASSPGCSSGRRSGSPRSRDSRGSPRGEPGIPAAPA